MAILLSIFQNSHGARLVQTRCECRLFLKNGHVDQKIAMVKNMDTRAQKMDTWPISKNGHVAKTDVSANMYDHFSAEEHVGKADSA